MKLPPIDFSKLVNLLKKEGGAELGALKPTPQPGNSWVRLAWLLYWRSGTK